MMGGKGSGRRPADGQGTYRRLAAPRGRPPEEISPGRFIQELMKWGLANDPKFYRLARYYHHIKEGGVGEIRVCAQQGVLTVTAWAKACPDPPPTPRAL